MEKNSEARININSKQESILNQIVQSEDIPLINNTTGSLKSSDILKHRLQFESELYDSLYKIAYNDTPNYSKTEGNKINFYGEPGIVSWQTTEEAINLNNDTITSFDNSIISSYENEIPFYYEQSKSSHTINEGIEIEKEPTIKVRSFEDFIREKTKTIRWKQKPDKQFVDTIAVGHTVNFNNIFDYKHRNEYERTPIIVRNYEYFTETIHNIFGKTPDTPTLIPVFILFQFELNENHYNNNFQPIKKYRDDYIGEYYEDTNITLIKEKRISGYENIKGTGLQCMYWLIKNNFIPAYYSILTDEDEIYNTMNNVMNEWMRKNNYTND